MQVFVGPAIVLVMNFVLYDLYFVWDWFDVFMHFLGGLSIGIGWLVIQRRFGQGISRWYQFVTLLGIVALMGVLWECMEFAMDYYHVYGSIPNQSSLADTMQDLVMDLLGGLVVAVYAVLARLHSSMDRTQVSGT